MHGPVQKEEEEEEEEEEERRNPTSSHHSMHKIKTYFFFKKKQGKGKGEEHTSTQFFLITDACQGLRPHHLQAPIVSLIFGPCVAPSRPVSQLVVGVDTPSKT